MPTGKIIFNLPASKGISKKVKALAKLSVKKLKYLKKPSNPRFTKRLTNSSNFRFD